MNMVGQRYIGNTRGSPRWLADFGKRDIFVPAPAKIDPTQFPDAGAVAVTTTALAAATATTIAVTALARPGNPIATAISDTAGLIPAGTLIKFGTGVYARTTAAAAVGATALTVEALPADVPSGSVGYYNPTGQKVIASGAYVGRTFAERDAGTPLGAAVPSDDEKYLLAFDVVDADNQTSRDVLLVKRSKSITIKENYLPNYDSVLNVGTAEVVTLTLQPGTDGGTFRVRRADTGAVTADLAWNAAANTVRDALRTLTGDATLATALVGEVYTVTFTTGFSNPPDLQVVNDSTNDGGVWEGGVIIARTTDGGKTTLNDIRAGWTCIKGTD
jgi:hypothetical protein